MGNCAALALGHFGYRGDDGKSLPSSFVPEEDQGYAFIQLQLRMLLLCSAPTPSCAKWMTFWRTLTGFRDTTDRRLQLLSNTSASYTGFYFLQFDPWHERESFELRNGLMRTLNQKCARKFRKLLDLPSDRPPFLVSVQPALQLYVAGSVCGTVQQLRRLLTS